jgi:hypothetical protein
MTAVGPMGYPCVPKETTYETSQTRHRRHRICQVIASQKFVSEEAVAIMRHGAPATYVSE